MASDYYATLGVPRGASDKEIKRAYRKLARQHHPDVNRDDADAERRFKDLQEAYRVLGDPKLRAQYDQFGAALEPGAGVPPGFGGFESFGDGRTTFRFTSTDAGDLGGLFSGLFGGGRRRASPTAARGRDVEAQLTVGLEEVDTGAERDVTLSVEDLCPTCSGSGAQPTGEPCRACGGLGVHRRQEALRGLRIPPGVQDGEVIRARGRGGRGAGGPAGDLLVRVTVRPHPCFERDGDDLVCEVPVTLAEAVSGGDIKVPTLGGPKPLKLPPGCQGSQRIRIKGQGLPNRRTGQRGNLVVRVRVQVPVDLRPDELRVIESISARQGDPRAELWTPPRARP